MEGSKTKRALAGLGIALMATLIAVQAAAQPTEEAPAPEPTTSAPGIIGIGAEVGGTLPFNALGPHVDVGIELGLRLPVLDHKLEVLFGAAYSPPGNSVSDGEYSGDIVEQELTFSLGPRYRFLPVEADWNASLAAGFRLFLLQSRSNGSAGGEDFAEFREHSTEPGFFAALGGERRLGPGALLLDLDFGYSSLPHKISGDTSTANLALTLGYRLYL